MSDICTLHDQAMHMMNEAYSLKNANRNEEARQKFLDACNLELQSASYVEKLPENEPSRSMLFLGAASLAWHGEDFALAERLIGEGLSGYPPEDVKNDLRQLLDDVALSLAIRNSSAVLREEEAEMRLYGDGVGHGRIQSKSLISRVEAINQLISRTTQRRYNLPFESRPRKRGAYPDYQIDIAWAEAGSFGIKLRLTQKIHEPISLLQKNPAGILKDVLDNLALLNSGDTENLKKNIHDEEYYIHFIAQAKEVFPDGNIVSRVAIIVKHNYLQLQNTRQDIRNTIMQQDISVDNKKKKDSTTIFRGYLMVSDGIKSQFTIVQDDGTKPVKIKVRNALEELAKKHFGDKVEAACEVKGKSYHLLDITPLSD
jgi:hypothetical protein